MGISTHLTALTRADPIVVPWWFVLADEAGLVHSRRGKWRWRAGDQFLWAGALCFNRCNGDGVGREETENAFQFLYFSSVNSHASAPSSAITLAGILPLKTAVTVGLAGVKPTWIGCPMVYRAISRISNLKFIIALWGWWFLITNLSSKETETQRGQGLVWDQQDSGRAEALIQIFSLLTLSPSFCFTESQRTCQSVARLTKR